MEWLLFAIVILGTAAASIIGGNAIAKREYAKKLEHLLVGSLKVDYSDPEGPYIFAEFKKPVETVFSHKYVILKVGNEPISHD